MLTPITANYVPDGDDWKVTVTRDDETLTERAPGLIAARDTAEQMVEKLSANDNDSADSSGATVVHLLDGDPVAFSTAYLHARHGGLAGAPTEQPATADGAQPGPATAADGKPRRGPAGIKDSGGIGSAGGTAADSPVNGASAPVEDNAPPAHARGG
jgi:hypothetical protein